METRNEKHAISLGIKIGAVFLTTVIVVILIAYFVLSKNFQNLMTDYTIQLVESMTEQGVKVVETELEIGRQEVSFLANSFDTSKINGETNIFPEPYTTEGHLRMVYVTEAGTIASDGRERDIREREDIRTAYTGQIAVYGPYYNEENEFVVCYSAPVKVDNKIVGILSVEKDGYQFCKLIENIRFVNSGECYIINAEGTDIAVSDKNHINWVQSRYNAREIYGENPDEETKSILDLEQKGLNGETGIGTYYWHDGLCYVFYKQIPSVGWVLFAGLREEEIVSMTQSAMIAGVAKSPILGICIFLVILLTGLIVFWIISNMKKTSEINQKLNIIANYDTLTGLMNRNSYHIAIDEIADGRSKIYACIYIDVNGLHEINNHLGHCAGDKMLCAVADALRAAYAHDDVYRIGGDEFVVLCREESAENLEKVSQKVKQSLCVQNYEISVGISYQKDGCSIESIVNASEARMQDDKRKYYKNKGNDRRMRALDEELEQMIVKKQDADTFIAYLAPEFNGVYFINLSKDTIRHIYIPSYFKECLQEANDQFSKALLIYAKKIVKPEYYHYFEDVCNYPKLEESLDSGENPEIIYQKLNGEWLRLRILKFKEYKDEQRETLWIFKNINE